MYVNRNRIEVGQLSSPETASNVHEKEFIIPKTISDCKK